MGKKYQSNTTVHRFLQSIDSIHRRKIEQILLAYGLPKETDTVIMMLYENMKTMVHSPDRDIDFFDIDAGVLQGDTLAAYLIIFCLDYVLQISDLIKEKGFTLKKGKKQMIFNRNYDGYRRCR